MDRRHVLTGAISLAFSIGAANAQAGTATETVPADKVFAYLSNYYGLPATDRTYFRLVYTLFSKTGKIDQITLSLAEGPLQVPLHVDSLGTVSPLPTAKQLKGKVILTRPDTLSDKDYGISLTFAPSQAPQQTMDARMLGMAVSQTLKAARKAAGVMSLMVPAFDRLAALGVTKGEVSLANGETRPLPFTQAFTDKDGNPHKAHVTFVPSDWPGAERVSFNTAPTRLVILPKV